ncbi:unnamed protein product [Heterobilharzia americana]|nr:unnamed protein product [Heterobilharzia americana]
MDCCKLYLISYSYDDLDLAKNKFTTYTTSLIPPVLVTRYKKLRCIFTKLMKISETIEDDFVYSKSNHYTERLHEDCEHHYPKLHPRNPVLDLKYSYAYEPSTYSASSIEW